MVRERVLRAFGVIGLVGGVASIVGGGFAGEIGGLLSGYGVLVVVSAGYLLVGLAIRDALRRRARPATQHLSVAPSR